MDENVLAILSAVESVVAALDVLQESVRMAIFCVGYVCGVIFMRLLSVARNQRSF